MVKKDEGNEKKTASRGRIMQVVEVEDDDVKKQNVDVPVPSEILKGEKSPDIADSFASPIPKEEDTEKETPQEAERTNEETPSLKTEEKKDIVSELFETKEGRVQYPNISLDKKPSPFGFILWVLVLLGIVGLIGGGLLYLKQRSTSTEPATSAVVTSTPTLTPTETETPQSTSSGAKKTPTPTPTKTASPSATPKKTGLSIQVLNGSGESGVASAMKKFLEGKGYNVVGTGNAKNFDYEKTEILIKSGKQSALDKLKTDLSESYTVGSASATLDESLTFDAQVIIGKE